MNETNYTEIIKDQTKRTIWECLWDLLLLKRDYGPGFIGLKDDIPTGECGLYF